MILTPLARASAALVAGMLFTSPGSAAVAESVKIKSEHPRLYGTQADFERLRQAVLPDAFRMPEKKGTLKFTITPVARQPGDAPDADIYGSYGGSGDRLVIRHADVAGAPGRVRLQIGGLRASNSASWLFNGIFEVTPGEPVDVEFTYDVDDKVTLKVGSAAPVTARIAGSGWSPKNQKFDWFAHRGDRIAGVVLKDGVGADLWRGDVDLELLYSWRGLLNSATIQATTLNGCLATATPSKDPEVCDTTNGGRVRTTEAAKRIALAYRFTGNADLLKAVRKHIELMKAVPLTAGGEWSMSARVGAIGIYYDWLYDTFKGTAEGTALAKFITDTIASINPTSSDVLIPSICGNQTLVTGSTFDCAVKPVFTGWVRGNTAPNTADKYVGAHTASAVTGSVLGLIAIADHPDYKKVIPMIDTIYDHFAYGFLPARDTFGPDGGNYAAFAYGSGSGETLDRLVMWQRAIAADSPKPALHVNAAPHMVYPYIYAVRHDKSLPARGDNFEFNVTYPGVGSMALAAATQAGDPVAQDFYDTYVAGWRGRGSETGVWDRLLYPRTPTTPSTGIEGLPLSAHFKVAGNVLMRNSWNYDKATLLEFKSTSFISENHQHLDQNSFSLNYRAPLLLDSGQYDAYGTGHWWNYYQRTIAHNAIVVYDAGEKYGYGPYWDNDGGQWYDNRYSYPTIPEITRGEGGQPDGANVLGGVTAFHEGGWYSYVSGDATLAYKRTKLAARGGAVRSIVYLRAPAARDGAMQPPTVLVYDRVQPTAALTATSLLHTVGKPAANRTLDSGTAGRFNYGFGSTKPLFTVRNGEGMVTVQPLLPLNPTVVLSGGKDEGSICKQIAYVKGTDGKLVRTPKSDSADCRFLIREAGTENWVNHAPDDATNVTGDVGNWRLEISASAQPVAAAPQYFLNVLHVADNDKGNAVRTDNLATLLTSSPNGVAVRTADGNVVVFHDSAAATAVLSWKLDSTAINTLVVGLVKKGYYKWAAGSQPTLTPVDTSHSSESGVKQASDDGALEL